MAFGCLSNLLRASFLTLALPLLLVGSLLSEVSRQLHLQSVNHLKYAIGEETTSAGLQVAAEESAAGAVEQQTEALEFEAEAARLQHMSAEDMQAAIEQREADAGMEVNEGAEEAVEGTEQLSATVDAAAEAAAAGDVAAGDAASGTAATAAASAAEVSEATAEAAEGATAAAAEGTSAAAAEGLTAGEAAALAGGEATAAEAGAIGGPVGLAVAGAAVAAAIEAPKAVAAAQGLSAEVQADKDEVLAVEREAQVQALETDSVIEEGGAAVAHDAAWTSMAAASGYFVSGQLVQGAAFALEVPVALVVFAQWTCGSLAPVFGILCGCCGASGALLKGSDDKPTVSQGASVLVSLTLTAAVGSLLLSPWAETVVFAAKLEAQDPTLAAIESLPQLFHEALKKHEKNEAHRNAKKDDKNASKLHITRRLWPNLTAMEDAFKDSAERTNKAAQGALQEGGKAVQGAASAVAKVMPENVKKAASAAEEVGKKAANATVHAAETAAEKLKEKAIRLKNGDPNVRTTTVAPRAQREAPNTNHLTMLLQAFSGILHCVWRWVLPVLRCIALTSSVIAVIEFGIAAGRHYPAVRTGSAGRHVVLGRMLHDVYSQWVWGAALLIAVWVLSIILATLLRGHAEWIRSQLQSFAWPFFCVQLLLCIVCLVASFSLARKLSQLEEGTDEAGKLEEARRDTSGDEERRLLESECGSQVSTTKVTERETGKVQARFDLHMASSMAASGICFIMCGVLDALLSAMENPVSAWALGASWKSLLTVRFLARLLPWSWVAPTILGYKLTSPYELLVPIVAASFIAGGLLVFLRRRNI